MTTDTDLYQPQLVRRFRALAAEGHPRADDLTDLANYLQSAYDAWMAIGSRRTIEEYLVAYTRASQAEREILSQRVPPVKW